MKTIAFFIFLIFKKRNDSFSKKNQSADEEQKVRQKHEINNTRIQTFRHPAVISGGLFRSCTAHGTLSLTHDGQKKQKKNERYSFHY
jgi:hypothetical protein